jgi:hypothetical protein
MIEELGQQTVVCQTCFRPQDITALLFGFEKENERAELVSVQAAVERVGKEIK